MTDASQRTFRAVALQRAASPEQLDHLVGITKPFDWILSCVICLALAAAITWGVLGRIPTRALGEGILVSGGGRVVDAVSAAAGRLSSVDVSVGDHVVRGQVIAPIVQTDIQQNSITPSQVFHEREREHDDLTSKVQRELAAKSQNFAKLEAAFNQVIKATDQRIEYLTADVKNLEDLLAKGYTTRRNVEDRRRELTDAQQRKEDTQNEILKLRLAEDRPGDPARARNPAIRIHASTMRAGKWTAIAGDAEPEHPGDQPDRGPRARNQGIGGLGACRRHPGHRDRKRGHHA